MNKKNVNNGYRQHNSSILVHDGRKLYAAYLTDRDIPASWRVTDDRQRTVVLANYCYAPPWEVF